eukprot:XP_019074093.1 PREDICTED: uncharacterized protein LOC104878432 [Vitis vinifera]
MSHHHPLLRELEQVEEENIQIPPPKGKRSPRAAKRRPKRPTTLIDEFLDESSQIRHLFFPDQKTAIDPMQEAGNDSFCYYPGRIWLDTDGDPIQAHGGGILYDKRSRMYYWYGEYKDGSTYHAHKKAAAREYQLGLQVNILISSIKSKIFSLRIPPSSTLQLQYLENIVEWQGICSQFLLPNMCLVYFFFFFLIL